MADESLLWRAFDTVERGPRRGSRARSEVGFVCDQVRLDGDVVRLRDIRVPMLTVIAERDHIVPKVVAAPLAELVGSEESEELRLDAGHVDLVVGRTAAKVTIPRIIEFLRLRSEPGEVAT